MAALNNSVGEHGKRADVQNEFALDAVEIGKGSTAIDEKVHLFFDVATELNFANESQNEICDGADFIGKAKGVDGVVHSDAGRHESVDHDGI